MSISPIESFPPFASAQPPASSAGSNRVNAGSESGATQQTDQTVSGTPPKQESVPTKNPSPAYQLPEDVVEVHQDPESGAQIIEYLDQAKSIVFQIPSNEELAVERGIAQELQEAAKLQATAETTATASAGEKNHGD